MVMFMALPFILAVFMLLGMTLGYPFKRFIDFCSNPVKAYKVVMWLFIAISSTAFILLVVAGAQDIYRFFSDISPPITGFRSFILNIERTTGRMHAWSSVLFYMIMIAVALAVAVYSVYTAIRVRYHKYSIQQFTLIGCMIMISSILFVISYHLF